MAKFRFHKLVALLVLAGSVAWIATGEFSSVGSAVEEDDAPEAAAAEEQARETPRRTVGVVTPPRREHARAIRISGRTEADKRAVLAARAAGIIAELAVSRGERVEAGDLVLELDAEEKTAAVETAEQLLAQREAEAEAAERLLKAGNLARLQADNARSALASARLQLETAKAELSRNEVRAPFSGLVDDVAVEQGSSIMQGGEIATLISLDPILAVGEVGEINLGAVGIGDRADIRLVDGREVEGRVRFVSRDASQQTRTFRVDIEIANPDLTIPAGMTAEITLRAEPVDSVVLPRSVVTLSADGDLGVRIVGPDDKVDFVPIDIVDDTPQALFLGGVPKDARVIVAGQELVAEGDVVEPKEADAETVQRLIGQVAGTQ